MARVPGDREMRASEFFEGFLESALGPRTADRDPRPETGANGWAFENPNRRAQDWAIVGALAANGEWGDEGRAG